MQGYRLLYCENDIQVNTSITYPSKMLTQHGGILILNFPLRFM